MTEGKSSRLLILLLMCAASLTIIRAEQVINANIAIDSFFAASLGPYNVTQPCVVMTGVTLTIEAGAVLRFTSASAVLLIRGTLVANGHPDARIIFEGVQGVATHAARLYEECVRV